MNKNVPSLKADMAKRMIAPGKYNKKPLWDRSGGAKHIGLDMAKHGNKSKSLTDQKDKHFMKGNMGQQGNSKGSPRKEEAGWENND